MKKNKILVLMLVLIGAFVFGQDVYADEYPLSYNIYDEDGERICVREGCIETYSLKYIGLKWDDFSQLNLYIDEEIPIPTRDGYTFDGWYTDENFENKITNDGTSKIYVQHMSIYGRWKKVNDTTNNNDISTSTSTETKQNNTSDSNNKNISTTSDDNISTSPSNETKKDNTMLYVGIGLCSFSVVLLIIVLILNSKRKKEIRTTNITNNQDNNSNMNM